MSDPSTPTKVKRSAFTGNQQKQQQELSAKPAINNYVTDTILLIQYKKIYRTLKKKPCCSCNLLLPPHPQIKQWIYQILAPIYGPDS